ncbi:MAG: hypothetical protein ACKO9I_05995 [Sphaerospermopsis kisseleviana]
MIAHKIQTTVNEDGTLTLQGLPFHPGDIVEVIILETKPQAASNQVQFSPNHEHNLYPLRGKVIHYDDPTEPVALEDWECLQ